MPHDEENRKLLQGKKFCELALLVSLKEAFYRDFIEKSSYWSGLSQYDKDKVNQAVDAIKQQYHCFSKTDQVLAHFIKDHSDFDKGANNLSAITKDEIIELLKKKLHIG